MAFTPKTWVARTVQYPGRRIFTPTGNTNEYDTARSEGIITTEGDLVSAENLNDLESRISAEFATKNQPNGYAGLDEHGNLKQMPTAGQVGAFPIVDYGDASTDPDTVFADGKYRCANWEISKLPSTAPDGQGVIEVIHYFGNTQSSVWLIQRLWLANNPTNVYWRYHFIASWSAWSSVNDGGTAEKASYTSGAIALTTAGLRNAIIIPESTTIPTGLEDGTIILKYTP